MEQYVQFHQTNVALLEDQAWLRRFKVLDRASKLRTAMTRLGADACDLAGFQSPSLVEPALIATGKGAPSGGCHIDANLPNLCSGILALTGKRTIVFPELRNARGILKITLNPGQAVHFPSQLRHFAAPDTYPSGLRKAFDSADLSQRSAPKMDPEFWAVALHYYVFEREIVPGTEAEIKAAVKETVSCAALDEMSTDLTELDD